MYSATLLLVTTESPLLVNDTHINALPEFEQSFPPVHLISLNP